MTPHRAGRLAHAVAAAALLATLLSTSQAQLVATPEATTAPNTAVWQLGVQRDHQRDALPLAARAGDDRRRLQRHNGNWTLGLVARSQAGLAAGQPSGALQWGLGWQLHERRASMYLAGPGRAGPGLAWLGASAHSRSLALTWQASLP